MGHPELAVPTIVVGLGSTGAAVARQLEAERREGRSLGAMTSSHEPPGPFLGVVIAAPGIDPAAVAAEVVDRARDALAHDRVVALRDTADREGVVSRLHVLLLAHLEEEAVRAALGETLSAIEGRLLGELAPIFEPYRTGAERNLVVLPLLAMPHPAAHARGAVVAATVHGLLERIAKNPPRTRAVSQLFLIEDVAEFSVLSPAEVEQCIRNFATLLLYSLPAVGRMSDLLYGREPAEPLATFACAVAELPRARLHAYAVNRVALEVLDAVIDASPGEPTLPDVDALEEVEIAELDPERDADEDVRQLLARYGPKIGRDPEPRWSARSEDLRGRYGPDLGDASLDAEVPPAEPPVGFALGRMREIESTWRLLQRRRFDDVIAEERGRIEQVRDRLLERIRRRIDRELFTDPDPAVFRRAAGLVSRMYRAVSLRLEDAIRDRDAAVPAPPPSFDSFRDAHASFLDAARRKPDLGLMLLYGAITVAALSALGPPLLRVLADATGVRETDWQSAILRDHGGWTAFVLALLVVGLSLGFHYRKHVLLVRAAFRRMWDALQETVLGAADSVLRYFASRLELARRVARVEALLAIQAAISADRERLTVVDRAARRARSTLVGRQRGLGVETGPDGDDDLTGLLGGHGGALSEPLVPPAARGAIEALLPRDGRDARVRDALQTLARDQRYEKRWREEVPFTSLDALCLAATPHARIVAEWDPLADAQTGAEVARHVAAFARRQARSLHVALNFTGHEARDPTGIETTLGGDAIVPRGIFDAVRRTLTEEGGGGRAAIPVSPGIEPDRAYYVVAVGDIAEQAVASLALPEDFEVEKDPS